MMHIVNRTCTETPVNESGQQIGTQSLPLSAYQKVTAYVLLGDPGAGKTTAFEQEAELQDACYITARDLITFKDRPEWHEKILFIDGLDEIRAGSLDARTPFDTIRARLDKLGHPRFRLSCREADWFGAADQELLRAVSPDGQVNVLHLDPLNETDVLEILAYDPRVPNAETFIRLARDKGLDDLLTNPQILDMLVNAVKGGNWPASRKQTFELACETIIREHNKEHIVATRTRPVNEKQQLSAIGFLCAAQLIAGNAGYAIARDVGTNDFPYIGELGFDNIDLLFDNIDLLNEVTRTKLFKSPKVGLEAPVHRHVAEYLAAVYLAEQIDKARLPIGRVLSLITGNDGVVVAELRGLSAWLAALCKYQRNSIIDRDPLGVVLYGDVQDFNRLEKLRVLDGLRREAARYPWFRSSLWATSPFGALATLDMEEEFDTILSASDRNETYQALVRCVLDAMTHGEMFPSLENTLLNIVRDDTWRQHVRRQALKVLHRDNENKRGVDIRLNNVLDDINVGMVADSDDELMGYLLTVLYPHSVTASEVLNYLHIPKQRNLIGGYSTFWAYKFLGQSSDSDIGVVLDELVARLVILRPLLDNHQFHNLTSGLLARGLQAHGEHIDSTRLYEWLGVGLDKYGWLRSGKKEHIDSIRSWFETHPELQKELVLVGLEICTEKEDFWYCVQAIGARLFHAEPPADFGLWCLERVQTAANDNIARYLLQQAVLTLCDRRGHAGLSLEMVEEITKRNSKHKVWLTEMLVCKWVPEKREYIESRQLRRAEKNKEKQQWMHYVKSNEAELREGRGNPTLMGDLATAYFGHFADLEGDTPIKRLGNFLDHDENLVQSVFQGLRLTLKRDDIPSDIEIFELNAQGRTYLLSQAFLAGLEIITRASPENVIQLGDDQIRQSVAFYLANGTGEDPDWYKSLLLSRPELVAEVMILYAIRAFRSNEQHIIGLYELANIEAYSTVARIASLTILKAFPARCTNQQLRSLDALLNAVLRYADRPAVLELIERKLNLRSMNVAQRVRWLAAGLIASPEDYMQTLADFVNAQENRAQELACFLDDGFDQQSMLNDLPMSALGLLVQLIGKFFAPYSLEGSGRVSRAMSAADLVNRMISRLGAHPGSDATGVLESLLADSGLRPWQNALKHAQFVQRAAHREASFRHPNIRQVSDTLSNLFPSNAGDLAALTMCVLQELADQIRNGNTDDYVQYWNMEGRVLISPKHEDFCRDALLSDIKQRLASLKIDAQPEGQYADDKRADIRVSYYGGAYGFEVPIEIKKNNHSDLWRAMHNQLILKYTREPLANGFGIYLVFWFGYVKTQPPPTGKRPRTAAELEDRLRASLSAHEGRKIAVCVIDVAKPE